MKNNRKVRVVFFNFNKQDKRSKRVKRLRELERETVRNNGLYNNRNYIHIDAFNDFNVKTSEFVINLQSYPISRLFVVNSIDSINQRAQH